MTEPIDVLRRAVTVGLPGVTAPAAADERVLSSDALAIAGNHRVQGLVWSAIQAGTVSADEHVLQQAREAHVQALRACLLAESWAVEALHALDRAHVHARVLKGVAIAHLDHHDAAERVFGDADLLIRRDDLAAALRALIGAGFTRHEPPVRSWWERRFGKAVLLVPPGGGELDLHLSITGGYFGERIDHDALLATSSPPFDLGGRPTLALDREGRLLQACCHAVLGGSLALRAQRDVAQLLLVSQADWRAVVERATRQGVELVIAEAIRVAWADLYLDPEHPAVSWASRCLVDDGQRRAFASYGAASSTSWGSEGLAVLPVLNRLDRVRFIAGLAWPSRASRRNRGRSFGQHVRRGINVMRRPT